MFKLIIYGFLIYLLYKFIFELVVPVSKATSQVKDQMREMQARQQQMQEAQQREYQRQQASATPNPTTPKKGDNDYIDFEEVK